MDKYIKALISIFDKYNVHTTNQGNLLIRTGIEVAFDAIIEVGKHDRTLIPENIEYLQIYACDLLRRYSV